MQTKFSMLLNKLYYKIRPLLQRKLQIALRREVIRLKRRQVTHVWPIDEKATKPPKDWTGWPYNKRFALVLTHDVETAVGQKKCRDLMRLEERLGVRSSFNFVPERYPVSPAVRHELIENGFEVGVHDLYHDGKLYNSFEIFQKRAVRINHYIREWESVGFRSAAMHHNLDWIHQLNIAYDASTFDTDPFEPQPDGMGTIFPFWVPADSGQRGYVELPYTLPQDFTLYILMQEKTSEIWRRKLDWIAQHGGMALINTHPDYMNFNQVQSGISEYPARYYEDFLEYVQRAYEGQYWQALPRQVARFYSKNFTTGNEYESAKQERCRQLR